MTQYNRVASVHIGKPGVEALKVSGLRITFDIDKSDSKNPNSATVSIYNLSENSRNLLKAIGELLYVYAGYKDGDGEENIFIGNITSINHKTTPPDVITVVTANDGEKEILEKKTSFSFDKGISGMDILKKVLEAFSIGNDISNVSVEDIQYANGFAYSGPADQALDKVTKYLGLSWSIQNNEIKLIPSDGNDGSRIIKLSPSAGLIDTPERLNGSTRKAKGKSKEVKPGWKVRSLLQPKLIPGGRIAIEASEVPEDSVFNISTVTHSGDTHGPEFATTIEVRE